MFYFIVLLIFLFGIFLLGYIISDGDFLAPTCVASLGFIFSAFCATINAAYWGLKLEGTTINTILGGLCIYLIVEVCVKFLYFGKCKSTSSKFNSTYNVVYRIEISNAIMILAIIGASGAIFLYLRQVLRVARRHGGVGSIGLLLNLYRQLSSFNVLDLKDTFPFWLNLLYVAVIGMGLFWSYIFINNYLIDKKLNFNLVLNLTLIVLSVVMNIVNANRTRMIMLAIAIMIYIWFIWHRMYGWQSGVKIKTLLKIAVAVLAFIFIFFGIRNIVGRNDSRSLLYVITHYFGAPIAGLNEFLKNPVNSTIWGKETFAGINNYIGNHFDRYDLIYSTQKEFRNIRGINIGNVYTAFRSYIHDFGLGGMVILTALESLIMSMLYYSNKKRIIYKIIDIRLLLLPLFYYADVLLFYADWFYEQINISIFRMVVMLLIIATFINRISLRLGKVRLVRYHVINNE